MHCDGIVFVKPKLGEHQPNNPKLVYTMDFQVTPHQLRHTYITNLIYASVDPKTVQYLAGHENSKVTMDIYAKVKYNTPAQLHGAINRAIDTSKKRLGLKSDKSPQNCGFKNWWTKSKRLEKPRNIKQNRASVS